MFGARQAGSCFQNRAIFEQAPPENEAAAIIREYEGEAVLQVIAAVAQADALSHARPGYSDEFDGRIKLCCTIGLPTTREELRRFEEKLVGIVAGIYPNSGGAKMEMHPS